MSYAEFNAVRIGIASPEQIRAWSYGEVKKPETINYRTLKPERDGLFCERIFGPTKDWECHCGKYKKIRFKGKICDRCGVEVTRAKVRRERMGHIELAAPVSHIWYFKGIPSRMGLLLDISPRILEKVLYFAAYIVTDPGPEYTHLVKNQILTDAEYRKYREYYEDDFDAGMGAEAVKKLLSDLDLDELSANLHAQMKDASGQKKAKLVKRLEVVDAFRASGNKPEWMIIDVLPVIPPELRPMVPLDGGRFATSDLNDLYRRVINRNNRLKRLMQLKAPDIIIRNEKRMLQEAVDALIDNGRRGRAVTGANNRALKSLSDLLKGKQGRFRQNLLGKRVDYSGRSVIVVGPELKIYQCGVPKEMAIELFRPFVMKKLVEGGVSNIKAAKKEVDKGTPAVWDALESVIKEHPVMLNRAPTLHRLGIQAFEPVLVEGRAMKLHPLVCTAFNADFDGDQMAIHVPLSAEAQTEARLLMLAANNLLRPSDGGPVTVPTQDMVLGSYYLTYDRDPAYDPNYAYETLEEATRALEDGEVDINDRIWLRDEENHRWYRTTPGLAQEAQACKIDVVPHEVSAEEAAQSRMVFESLEEAAAQPKENANERIWIHNAKDQRWYRTTPALCAATLKKAAEDAEKEAKAAAAKKASGKPVEEKDEEPKEQPVLEAKRIQDAGILANAFANFASSVSAVKQGLVAMNELVWLKNPEGDGWVCTTGKCCLDLAEGRAKEVMKVYGGDEQAQLAYAEGVLDLHEPILVRRTATIDGEERQKMVRTTVGRLIFNEGIPQDLGFVDRSDPEKVFEPEINFKCGKKQLGQIVDRCINKHGFTVSAAVLDTIKARGYKFSTRGALTVAIADMTVPEKKKSLIAATEKEIVKIENQYRRGFLTDAERYRLVVASWEQTTKDVSVALQESMDPYNPIKMMADSGARGSDAQIRQLAGMRGLMADTSGRTIEIPVKANFREGLSVLEYFISSRGARKGMADTALRTADSGYLTRRLVDVSQEVIIREEDCGTHDGITVSEIFDNNRQIETLKERLRGRYLSEDLVDPDTGEVLVSRDTMVTGDIADFIEKKLQEQLDKKGSSEKPSIRVRSVLTCRARTGVCAHCYGMNLAFGEPVGMGEAVGIIAAQSIGEPGTQLTMRTFHTGGVAGGDITQGLPRVEELFEARKPKKMAQLAEIGGAVTIDETKRANQSAVTITAEDGQVVTYNLPHSLLRVKAGDTVVKGQQLTEGALSPHEVLRIRGVDAVHNYLIQEVQKPYRVQGVDINDKHIEVIVRQMMRKVRVEDPGDSNLLSGSQVDVTELRDAVEAIQARTAAGETREDGSPLQEPQFTRMLLGITKASLATESFLSAASFQETTKVLTEAAIKGKVDRLQGLKENVIIGKLIPAGSGLAAYRKLDEIEEEVHAVPHYRPIEEENAAAVPMQDADDDDDDAPEDDDEILSVTLDDDSLDAYAEAEAMEDQDH